LTTAPCCVACYTLIQPS